MGFFSKTSGILGSYSMMALILSPIGLLSMALFGMYTVFNNYSVPKTWQAYVYEQLDEGKSRVALDAVEIYLIEHPHCSDALEIRDMIIDSRRENVIEFNLSRDILYQPRPLPNKPRNTRTENCSNHELILGKG